MSKTLKHIDEREHIMTFVSQKLPAFMNKVHLAKCTPFR